VVLQVSLFWFASKYLNMGQQRDSRIHFLLLALVFI
jgi:hypothetical protein